MDDQPTDDQTSTGGGGQDGRNALERREKTGRMEEPEGGRCAVSVRIGDRDDDNDGPEWTGVRREKGLTSRMSGWAVPR